MHIKICDMTPGTATFEGFYLLNSMSLKQTAAGKTYLSGEMSDCSGNIPIVFWDYANELTSEDIGSVIKVRGSVSEYKDKKQFTISLVRRATEEDRYDQKALVPCAPIDVDEAMMYVSEIIGSIKDKDYRAFAEQMFALHFDALKTIPAAKGVHHAFISGLLMHTSCMLKVAEGICSVYGTSFIDRDLLLTGVLVHDMAKCEEFETTPLGLVKDYTADGNLLGHTVMGIMNTEELANDLGMPENKKRLIQHMIASHHGLPEWGAASAPQTIEAEILHHIDMIDSRIEIYRETLDKTPTGTFSNRIFALDHKVFNHD